MMMMKNILLVAVILFLGVVGLSWADTREYYIAVVEKSWNYIDPWSTDFASRQRPDLPKYTKAVYCEYTNSTFTTLKSKPPWAGIQGPTIRAQVNDRVVIHFKNFGSQPFSISPIGIPYWKQSEGVGYDDSTTSQEQGDDAVAPGGYYKYVWDIHILSGPTSTDPDCLTYSYSSRVDIIRDFNSGLIGPLLICRAGVLTKEGNQKVPEFILLFAVFDENKSWFRNLERSLDKFKKPEVSREYHTINGHSNSSLPGLTMCMGYDDVSWHLIGVGSSPEIHSIQFQEYSLQVMKHRKVSVEMAPMTFTTALMKPVADGTFQISCRIHSNKHAGMSASFTVNECADPVGPDKRNAGKEYGDYGEFDFGSTVVVQGGGIASVLRSGGRGKPRLWIHYIAAEEVTWDYAPNVDAKNKFASSENLRRGSQRLGKVYKKVAFVEYTDKTFTKKKDASPGIGVIGPVLTGEVGDNFQIVFKNLATRPYNIYPNGLTSISSLIKQGAPKNMKSLAIKPGETFTYLWKLTSEDGPTDSDPRCLTRLYQSTLNPEKDLASGLVGSLIVCKPGTLDRTGRVVTSDKEKHLMFAIFDENKSWYINENIQTYSEDPNNVNTRDPDFYKSNVMPTVNGLMYSNLHFRTCLSDVTFWHLANVGTQDDFLSVYFTGNPFEKDKVYDTVVTLFPMSGETVATEMETLGEWEISAYDPILKARGMSARYSVFSCAKELPLVDSEDDYDFNDYMFDPIPMPRGSRRGPGNQTVAIRVCRPMNGSDTLLHNTLPIDGMGSKKMVCEVKYVSVAREEDNNVLSEGGIPDDILAELDKELGLKKRRKRSLTSEEKNIEGETSADQVLEVSSGESSAFPGKIDLIVQEEPQQIAFENSPEGGEEEVDETPLEKNKTIDDFFGKILRRLTQDSLDDPTQTLNETLEEDESSAENHSGRPSRRGLKRRQAIDPLTDVEEEGSIDDLYSGNEMYGGPDDDATLHSLNQVYIGDKDLLSKLMIDPSDLMVLSKSLENSTDNTTNPRQPFSFEYDDYSEGPNISSTNDIPFEGVLKPRSSSPRTTQSNFRSYYIAAEEVMWDYGVTKPHQLIRPKEMRQGYRKYLPTYKKVVFRAYLNKDFKDPVKKGELDEHLGIMGPVLKAEVDDVLTVVFRNKANRPYSLHLQGVYDKLQGLSSSNGIPGQSYRPGEGPGDPVPPGAERVYNWRITKRQGPTSSDFDCKTGAYYSTVDKEKDLHSGLIGPLLICKPGTLRSPTPGVRDLFLLFNVFDERKSWYMDDNIKKFCTPPCRANRNDPWFEMSNRFSAINGYVAETLPGLAIEQYEVVRWHLMNVGSGGEFHSVHFHGLPFSVRNEEEHRMGVFNLYPGVFGTVEMRPAMLGTWMVECTIGDYQLSGMRAKLLVYNPKCIQPLGMQSGIISDEQISASDHYDYWEPGLARLGLSGSINAWVGLSKASWLKVDLRRPMLIHGIQTQGARTTMGLVETFTMYYTISYSMDDEHWKVYKGNTTKPTQVFTGNWDGSNIKENLLSPPIIGRYIKLNPVMYKGRPTFRLEFLGCDLNSCLMPLGMQKNGIPNTSITASSYLYKWLLSWTPSLARLHQKGRANAWRPKSNDPHQWIQVDFMEQKKVTGIVTQGARAMLQPMMVTEYSVSTSDNGHSWSMVMERGAEKIFEGNTEYDEEKLNLFDPPLFARYIRVHPKGWVNDIALRLEFLGCQTQQRL